MELEIGETPAVLARILDKSEEIAKLAELISGKRFNSVMIVARGTSDNAAHFLKQLIEVEIGIPVGLASPSIVTVYGAQLNYQGALVIAISQSGQSPDLIKYLQAAKLGGVTTLSLTNDSNSPLAKSADHHLDLSAGEEKAVAATKSYTAQLFTSLLLATMWSGKESDYTNLEKTAEDLVKRESELKPILEELNSDTQIVVIGRGYSYANAKELALKIQETSQIAVQGMSAADYLHGPIAAVDSETRVFLFLPNSSNSEGLVKTVAKLRERTSHLIWIGSGELAVGSEKVLSGSAVGSEAAATVLDAILLQKIALRFAEKNGFNPDSPEGLSKVTLTL